MPSQLSSALPALPGLPARSSRPVAALLTPRTAAPEAPERLHAGTAAYRRTARGMFVGGFATFAMLYGFQPLLPQFSHHFHLTPAEASSVMSAATGTLALMLIPAGIIADRFGRKGIMSAALGLAACLTLAAALAADFRQLVLLRALFGLVMAGLPAVAMAYLSEEVAPDSLGRSMGLYIAGNALGGMSGRLMASALADWSSWRMAAAVLGGLGLLATLLFWRSLPASRHFHPSRVSLAALGADCRKHFSDAGLRWLFVVGFLLMGSFVSLYNYLGYRLALPPFDLRPGQIGLVFSLYLVGMWASAWAGRLADRLGRRNVLWVMVCVMALGLGLTLTDHLAPLLLGIGLFTFGFFAAHSVSSSWIGRRASTARALASALYLAAYYLGSSSLGSFSGLMWGVDGWRGIAALLGLALATCIAVALHLRRLPPALSVVPVKA